MMTSTSLGTIDRDDREHATIRFERRLPARIERVWAAITTASELEGWLADSSVDLRVGGTIEHVFEPGQEGARTHGLILVLEPPSTLEYEWRFSGEAESILRYDLIADGDETVLMLTHRSLGLTHARGYGAGWHAYLDALDACLSGGPAIDWGTRYAAVRTQYEEPTPS